MNILLVHRNFPAQYKHLVQALLRDPSVRIAAVGSETARAPKGVLLKSYALRDASVAATHPFARRFDMEARRAEQVLYALSALRAGGFVPDVIMAHPGWGETLPLRTVFPDARIIVYCEFFYGSKGRDVGFDPEFADCGLDGHVGLHAKNAATLLALAEADQGLAPTEWQRSTFPAKLRSDIAVIHEGVDTGRIRPDPVATFALASGRVLTRRDPVVTFVARNLEPQRGYHVFMRALPRILSANPRAEVLIVGGHGVSYGAEAPGGQSWKDIFLAEVADRIDPARVHFTGWLPYDSYLRALQVSSAHIYLTYPFVLSWSLLEAMSAGCLVVGSDTDPVREAITDGETGLLVPFFDAEALAERVGDVLGSPRRYDGMRDAARRSVVERFDLDRVCLPRLLALVAGQTR